MTKYFIAHLPEDDAEAGTGRVLVRSSTTREYSHAVLVRRDGDMSWGIAGCCSRLDLAQKREAEELKNRPGRTASVRIVEVTEVPKSRLKDIGGGRATLVAPKRKKAKATPKSKPAEPGPNPTKAMYDTLYAAYDHFNAQLFGDTPLPPVVLLVHRKRNAHGYFWDEQWTGKDSEEKLAEIALNPETMGRDVRETLSTLVHEMVHQWDAIHGKVPNHGHGRTWADKMDEVGLAPYNIKEPKKRTGRNCTHKIVDGGPFAAAYDAFMKLGHDFSWFSPPKVALKKKDLSKVKHTCPDCHTNIWGKQGLNMICGDCNQVMEEA